MYRHSPPPQQIYMYIDVTYLDNLALVNKLYFTEIQIRLIHSKITINCLNNLRLNYLIKR